MKRFFIAIIAAVVPVMSSAMAEPPQRVPFIQSLSNNVPLAFGMSAHEASAALGVPLAYVSGKPGNEMLAAVRPSPMYINRGAHLFLQFRNSRLTGWKGDWRQNWMWD
jgi:hypothetical protein